MKKTNKPIKNGYRTEQTSQKTETQMAETHVLILSRQANIVQNCFEISSYTGLHGQDQ